MSVPLTNVEENSCNKNKSYSVEVNFTERMRRETRKEHRISDALINAKLTIGMTDSKVWVEGLRRFYVVYRYLEIAMKKEDNHNLHTFSKINGLFRTERFESSLRHYLGEKWLKALTKTKATEEYLNYLQQLEKESHTLLSPFIYHMYMGILSGGQVLMAKQRMAFSDGKGSEAFYFDINVKEAKCELKKSMNELADKLDDETKLRLLKESKMVYLLNNKLVKEVKIPTEVLLMRLMFVIGIFIFIILLWKVSKTFLMVLF
ncbi:heme oxygenase 1 [Adelges cooleyi]|uniref:heme oxygenase 1 n=1 Tax=Adelges cooleyi TaxID=133065 RepID=UPI00217F5E42|nr:heme oxygenase 1 [Adelges cooleyi]